MRPDRVRPTATFVALMFVALPGLIGWQILQAQGGTPASPATRAARIERGAYLVKTSACTDCHTPLKMGPRGPEPDQARALSGHPQDLVMPPAPALPPGPWAGVMSATSTAWAGPWGVSFTANLTPDPDTGLGRWTEDMFLTALRTGRHEGKGRPILPPMPAAVYAQMTDEDLRSIFAYLQSVAPIRNQVPQPIDPVEAN